VRATEQAIAELGERDRNVTTADIERLQHVIEPGLKFGLRTEQNWVGGSGWSPLRADFVPPPETEVQRLVDDLARFVTNTTGNPVVRAAIAHAQFETIHPFVDGNGRTGRALIHTVLRRADALRNTLIPISTVFAGDKDRYIAGLTAYREIPSQLDEWIIGFAEAAELAAENAVRLSADITSLDERVREELIRFRQEQGIKPSTPRSDAVALKILSSLAADPVLTIESVAAQHEVTAAAAHRALVQLAEAGILGRTKDHKGRLIYWTADRHLALVSLTERSNRVGAGNTANGGPRLGPPAPHAEQVGVLRPLLRCCTGVRDMTQKACALRRLNSLGHFDARFDAIGQAARYSRGCRTRAGRTDDARECTAAPPSGRPAVPKASEPCAGKLAGSSRWTHPSFRGFADGSNVRIGRRR
jgi:Fic family protein